MSVPRKTALITGASSGIGYELARCFAGKGYNLVLVARREDRLQQAKSEFEKKYSVRVRVISGNLSDPQTPRRIFDELTAQTIEVDVLVNNAGLGAHGFFIQTPWEKEEEILAVNVTALTAMTKLFVLGMVQRKSGQIINVASIAAFLPGPLMSTYYASKAYVLSFSEALANELKGSGVSVTALCPGPTQSEFQRVAGVDHSRLFDESRMATSKEVAEYGFRAAARCKVVAVHGVINRIFSFAVRFVPRQIVAAAARKLQERRIPGQIRGSNIAG